ncbi:MAG: hypothetical protein QOJ07_3418, partial [Thermoleophilaceae bacterium]|nr:hypothetical protein [Thermoleophilaceae bacterium]
QTLLEEMPYFKLSDALPDRVAALIASMPILRPVIPDPGTPFQLVHEDDVASAFVAGVRGKGSPGPYNLAGNGTLQMSALADALGWYSVPLPRAAIETSADLVARIPNLPAIVSWIHSVRKPVLLKTDRARKELGWKPEYTSRATLKALVSAFREEQRIGAN